MDKEGPFFLGVDCGTESVRGGLFNVDGKRLVSEEAQYKTIFPHPGWAEQRPDDWWEAFVKVINGIVKKSDINPRYIVTLTVDTTSCTVLLLDRHCNPLRNALLWMDVRSFKQAQRIAESKMDTLKYNGYGSVSAEWMPSKALWLKQNEIELYNQAAHVCEFQDWMNYKLTGELCGSINNVTIRWYYNSREGGWPTDFYNAIGLGDAVERFPAPVLGLGVPIGKLKPDVASLLGLTHETVVVQGGADAYIGALGVGAVKPGRIAFITGSSHLMIGHTREEFHTRGIFGAFPDALIPGLCVVEGAQISSGSVLKWFKENFINREYEQEAKRRGITLYEYLSSLAEKVKPGSEGLILLNYWQGNRNPLTDSQARGVIWGLSLKHTPVHVYRAIMEGVSYGSEHIMRYFKGAGFVPDEVYACGGATKSELWMQIQSDVLGLPILLTEEPNAPLLGDAIIASYGIGVYSSIEEAASRMVRVIKRIEPDPDKTEEYRYYVDMYIETYPRLKDLMHDMVGHETGYVTV
jgi:ribulokinase